MVIMIVFFISEALKVHCFITERYYLSCSKERIVMKGWLVIGACILGIVAFILVLYLIGSM